MIRLVTERDGVPGHVMAQWAIERLPDEDLHSVADLGNFTPIGVMKDGKVVCVVIYNYWRQMPFGNDLRVIIVSENPAWCLPGVLRKLFEFPFQTAGCTRLTAVIRDGNTRSFKLCRGLGFKKEGTLRRAFNGRTNAIVMGMLKEECKWLRPRSQKVQLNGQEKQFGAEAA